MKREFYICDDRLYVMTDGKSEEVTEKSRELIDEMLTRIETYYPEALKALNECYAKSSRNVSYYNYLRVRRFLRCNFAQLDTTEHDDDDGVFNFERVPCPLRGECPHEGVICMPRFDSRISAAEERVMRLYLRDGDTEIIAETLYLSVHTVRNHIKAAYTKLGVHSRAEFIAYASRHHLFD
ncbi:MAG: helix-turn-helix transcriptional regulator [Bacteroides sp.]|nr:helix-turn-helix transcriptional regulator [Bacteroides sp.]